jgi:hypothetical protein
VEFVKSNTLLYTPTKVFDLVFVDDDHNYDHLKKEIEVYRHYAKYMAFHDIDNPDICPGVSLFWNEIKTQYPDRQEFVRNYSARCMGIGLIRVV